MKYYAGLDVSMEETAICVVNQEGDILFEDMRPSEPKYIAKYLKETELEISVVGLETGSITRWLATELKKLDVNAIAIDARRMAAYLNITINKNDPNDARGIAQAVRSKMYREVYVKSDEAAQINVLLGTRDTLVKQRTQTILTIRGHLKSVGIRPGPFSHENACERLEPVLKKVPSLLRSCGLVLLDVLNVLNAKIAELEQVLKNDVKESEQVKLLKTIPGVGPLVSTAFVNEMEDPTRFTDSRSVPAYFGLTPRLYESGDTHIMG